MGDDVAKGRWRPLVGRQRLAGTPVTAGPYTVTPVSRVVLVRLPFAAACWQRPDAVLVARDGVVRRLPIPDATRRVRAGLLGGALVLLAIGRALDARRKEGHP